MPPRNRGKPKPRGKPTNESTHDMRTKLATAARWARHRPRTDQQGIALQTVIVIVVMLVIAGGVAGVLLSRGNEVMADLEGVEVNVQAGDSFNGCQSVGRSLRNDQSLSAVTGTGVGAAAGIWYDASAASGTDACWVADSAGKFSEAECERRGGEWGTGATAVAAQCKWKAS